MKQLIICISVIFLMVSSMITNANMTPLELHQSWQQVYQETHFKRVPTGFPYIECFKKAGIKHDLPVPLLLAVARGESDFDSTVISKANAIGIMQIQWPGTAKHLGIHTKDDLFKPCINIEAGARYLNELLKRYNDLNLALAAYNYGPGRIKMSMDWQSIPKGATWYSGYIYDHFRYITDEKIITHSNGKIILISFDEPYRAQAFKNYLKQQVPDVLIEWFKDKMGRFSVTVSFTNNLQRSQYLPKLKHYRILN